MGNLDDRNRSRASVNTTKHMKRNKLQFNVLISDDEPPTIKCTTPQIFYADKGFSTASSVVWEEPTAHDTVDEKPVIEQTKGPSQNTTLSKESTYVSYVAKDAIGNESPECSIELRLKSKIFVHKQMSLFLNYTCMSMFTHFHFFSNSDQYSYQPGIDIRSGPRGRAVKSAVS